MATILPEGIPDYRGTEHLEAKKSYLSLWLTAGIVCAVAGSLLVFYERYLSTHGFPRLKTLYSMMEHISIDFVGSIFLMLGVAALLRSYAILQDRKCYDQCPCTRH